MGSKWAQNLFLIKQLDDDQMQVVPYPRLELHIHVLYKTVEAGVILGAIVGSAIALIKKRPMGATLFTSSRNGAIIGAVAAPLMTEKVISGNELERIYDRSYRLRYNRNQVRVDRFVTYGTIAGAATSAFMGSGALPGMLIGIGAFTFAGGIYNTIKKETLRKAPHALPKEKRGRQKEQASENETKTE